jgi:glutathione peroxidase-family protein
MINERDFDFEDPKVHNLVSKHISPNWSARLDTADAVTFTEQMERFKDLAVQYPDVQFELLDVDCRVYWTDRTANVFLHTAMHKRAGVSLLGLCELKWKFTGGRWMWYSHMAMRGPT